MTHEFRSDWLPEDLGVLDSQEQAEAKAGIGKGEMWGPGSTALSPPLDTSPAVSKWAVRLEGCFLRGGTSEVLGSGLWLLVGGGSLTLTAPRTVRPPRTQPAQVTAVWGDLRHPSEVSWGY